MSNSAPPKQPAQEPKAAGLIVGAIAVLGVMRLLGQKHLADFVPDLGSLYFPAPRQAAFVMTYGIFGTVAALLLTWGLARLLGREDPWRQAHAAWHKATDAQWMKRGALGVGLMAAVFHLTTLRGARLTDDEAAYQFMAELIASGRLYAPSHAIKLFFDNAFMINDGRLYAKYLLGWPILLAPGALLGMPGLMNSVYFGLTVPPLYRVLQQYAGAGWARAGVLLLGASPMLLVGAATMMSHTSCMCLLAWAWYMLLLAQRDAGSSEGPAAPASWKIHAAFAACLALAALNRPTSAIGIGAPMAIAWLWHVVRLPSRERWVALSVFSLVALIAAATLLALNYAQTGNPLLLAYSRMNTYTEENLYRFSPLVKGFVHTQLSDPLHAISMGGVGLLRLSFSLFGFPCGIALAWLALGMPQARLAWFACFGFTLVHLPLTDAGIDTFGPVHWYEIALPILVLTVLALARISEWSSQLSSSKLAGSARAFAPSLLMALIATAWIAYMPIQTSALGKLADDILAPIESVEAANIHNAVVFSPRPWGGACYANPTRNFVFFRPNNDPDLKNDVLWVNHLGLTRNKALMAHFPGRTGYILLRRPDCAYQAFTLQEIDPKLAIPPVDDLHDGIQLR